MKYLKLFESFPSKMYDFKINLKDMEIKVIDAYSDDSYQIDWVRVEDRDSDYGDGCHEFYFDIYTSRNQKMVKFKSGPIFYALRDGAKQKFVSHFNLVEDEFIDEGELMDFLDVDSKDCVGKSAKVGDSNIKISKFFNDGGVELGTIETKVNDANIKFAIEQRSSGPYRNGNINVYFSNDEEKSKAEKLGLKITDELSEFLATAYDRITSEKR